MIKFITNIEETIKDIKRSLVLNEQLRQLLVLEEPSTQAKVSVEQAAEHVFLMPIIEVGTTEPFNKKTYISITVPDVSYEVGELTAPIIFRVVVQCERSHWVYGDNSIRPLKIAQLMAEILEDQKFALTNPLKFNSMVETRTDAYVIGYSLFFNAETGVKEDVR